MPPFKEHSLRAVLAAEVHVRPFLVLRTPARVSHLAVVSGEHGAAAERVHLETLCQRQGVPPPALSVTHFAGEFGPFRLKWERHTEFSTYTFVREEPFEHPFVDPVVGWVPADWLQALPGAVLSAVHLSIESRYALEPSLDSLGGYFDRTSLTGSSLMGGISRVFTDFRVHGDGYGRILVRVNEMDGRTAGRLVQRVLEIETYRMMAMLGFPLAKEARGRLAQAERSLGDVVAKLASIRSVDDERRLLERLSNLATEAEAISAETSYRFGATRAYYGLVQHRIEDMRESRIDHLQPLAQFLLRRLAPAMATCEAVAAREDSLSRRIARASDLLRTRIDVALEEQNRDLLRSMNRRAQLQLRLQQTVEGLSVVAISYYGLGLLQYLFKGIKAAGFPIDPDIGSAVALPFLVLLVWLGVRRVRRALIDGRTEDGSSKR